MLYLVSKVRGIYTEKGTALQTASLSTPVEVLGWRDLPLAGDQILQVKSEVCLLINVPYIWEILSQGY